MIIHTSGLPAIGDDETLLADDYFYLIGATPPRHPVPSIHTGGYVLACGITDSGALVIWCADHEVIAL